MPAETQRASPDALLALTKQEGRGHLKIFLGAAPGVGKTFAMLAAAHSEKLGGRDVLAGLIETHGRQETEALLAGLEALPRKPVVYHNRIMHEFDLDAALERRPGLILVDEYAHTNIPGSRHPKRWQDIAELLETGIDVWTTLNIQHLESLNDVIQKITQVRVRETVPDRVFEEADEIVLVDFPPDELLKRLAEGKVYVQDTAARAVQGFFKPENLTALRELALRRAAERIDTDLVGRMKAQGLEGPWAAGERILACVGPGPAAQTIVRTAKRLADLMDAPWIALVVERPARQLNDAQRRDVDEALRLAESLGAEARSVVANDLPTEILRLARFENVTQIVVGRAQAGRLTAPFRRPLAYELARTAEDIAIHIVTGKHAPKAERAAARSMRRAPPPMPYVAALIAVAAAFVFSGAMDRFTPFEDLGLIFLMAVLFTAIRYGMWPGLFASFVSFLTYNFFFIEPLHTLTIAKPYELVALLIFFAVALLTSTLAGRTRDQARIAVSRMRAMRRLYDFTRKLSRLADPDSIAEAAATEVHASLERTTLVLLYHEGGLHLAAAWPPEEAPSGASMMAAQWASTHDEPAGAGTSTLPTVPWHFLPLRTPRGRVGVLGIAAGADLPTLDSEARTLLETLSEQTAASLERASLSLESAKARAAAETEQLRNTLLASVSHDFRTPLASILGSATSLIDYGERFSEGARQVLLADIKSEAEGLDEMVRNLLSITRIDAGALELHRDWIDLREIVGRVIAKARQRGARQDFKTLLPADLPLIVADAILVEQAIGNVLGNAVAHTPSETRVEIAAQVSEAALALSITDTGPGIAPDVLPRAFEKFVGSNGPSNPAAQLGEHTGLGLAIAKGILEAHGGTAAAQSPVADGRGTRILLSFPRGQTPQ